MAIVETIADAVVADAGPTHTDTQPPPRVVLFLGPYRNLTTLWSSVLSLHPSVVVVNHITPELDSLLPRFVECKVDYDTVVQTLLAAVGKERKPLDASHALRDMPPAQKEIYQEWQDRKSTPTHILWKDSGRLTREFRQRHGQLRHFVAAYPQVLFVMPLRNVVDMVRSNMEKPQYLKAYDFQGSGYIQFIDWYLDQLQWFFRWVEKEQKRFCPLLHPSQLLLDWLKLEQVPGLMEAVLQCYHVRPASYCHQVAGNGIRSYLRHRLAMLVHSLSPEQPLHPVAVALWQETSLASREPGPQVHLPAATMPR